MPTSRPTPDTESSILVKTAVVVGLPHVKLALYDEPHTVGRVERQHFTRLHQIL